MVLNCKVSCEVNLSKGRKYKEEDNEKVTKPFACRYCPYSSNRSYNVRIHEERKHGRPFSCPYCSYESKDSPNMRRHLKIYHSKMVIETQTDNGFNEKIDNVTEKSIKMNNIETVSDENKYIESILNRVKTDFERKRELGKIAMEMIDKYDLNVHGMPQEVKNAIKFNLKMEGLC